jgi:type IV pilus assembly protein PilV
MIEVLVTLVILLFGLLGLAALQSRAQVAETESYQRTQALILLRDMADRINANRGVNYVAAAAAAGASWPVGTGPQQAPCPPSASASLPIVDICQWDGLLRGAAESASGVQVGAMVGARGCIEDITPVTVPPSPPRYLVSVVWQGLGGGKTAPPPASVACGSGSYGSDDLRRAVTTVVQIGDLNAP